MSKVDAQRAMKAARHARPPAPTAPPTRRATVAEPGRAAGDADAPAAEGTGAVATSSAALCVHRSMAGKECRRLAGHAEKSHRYS